MAAKQDDTEFEQNCCRRTISVSEAKWTKRTWFDSIGQAANGGLFTSAIPLLLHTKTFAYSPDFWPRPVRLSLYNLDSRNSSQPPMLMLSLVRTPDRHRTVTSGDPDLEPFQAPALQAAVTVGHQPNQPQERRTLLLLLLL